MRQPNPENIFTKNKKVLMCFDNNENRYLCNMKTLNQYIKKIRIRGRRYFTYKEVQESFSLSKPAFNQAVYRLIKKGDVASPYYGFYVLVDPEDAAIGCMPGRELIPLLMKHLGVNYYVAFLSAGGYYGAAHQKPMVLQVVSEKRMKDINCGHVRIRFTYKRDISNIPVQKKVVDTGYLNVSTPEATAMDILNFQHKSVGINNIATVLSELLEEIEIPKLIEMAKISGQKAWVQRMGYILEHIDSMEEEHQKNIIDALEKYLSDKNIHYIPLSSVEPRVGSRDKKWKIIENTIVDSDL